jgi:hypothetical protein
MCFGQQQTGEKVTTSTPNPAVAAAATGNIDFVKNLQSQGFTPYSGQQVAGFSPQQQSSFDMTNAVANNGTGDQAKSLINQYSGAPAQSVSADTIANNMTPYMNQYVMQALAPQLQQFDVQAAKTRQATDATATGSGAFGDARTGIEQANNSFLSNVAREGLIGNAYNQAFNTAIGAGATDVGNKLNAGTTNANLAETALNRSLGGATALQGLQNQQLGVAGAQNTMGAQQTAQQQADLTAQYNQWLMAQQYPFQTAQLMNQTTAAASGAMPATQTATTSAPDNSGLALLGSLGSAFLFSDIRLKEDIAEVGELHDGTPVFSYRYKGDPTPQIGLMSFDVKRRRPDAVRRHPSGFEMVDYSKATERSRLMAMAI